MISIIIPKKKASISSLAVHSFLGLLRDEQNILSKPLLRFRPLSKSLMKTGRHKPKLGEEKVIV